MAFRLPLPAPRDDRQDLAPAEAPLYPPPAVWCCSECGDVYDGPTPDGDCPNRGHAPVKLRFASIQSVRVGRGES